MTTARDRLALWARLTAPDQDMVPEALADVISERIRQVGEEGFTPEHDDRHAAGELAMGAAAYCFNSTYGVHFDKPPGCWPWDKEWWKPTTPRRDLVKAGALILAEIERLDREAARAGVAG